MKRQYLNSSYVQSIVVVIFFAGIFVYMPFTFDDNKFMDFTYVVSFAIAFYMLTFLSYGKIAFMRYYKGNSGIVFKNFRKTIRDIKYNDVRYSGYYSAYTFDAVNESKGIVYRGGTSKRIVEAPIMFLSKNDLSGYKDQEAFMHLLMLCQFAENFNMLYPSEFYFFTVLYLLPEIDKPVDDNSLISMVVHDQVVKGQLEELKHEYEDWHKMNKIKIYTHGLCKLSHAVKKEYHLFKCIDELPLVRDALLVTDDYHDETRIERNIPSEIIWHAKLNRIMCVYDKTSGIKKIDLCFKQRVSTCDHISGLCSDNNEYNNEITIPWENTGKKDGCSFSLKLSALIIEVAVSICLSSILLNIISRTIKIPYIVLLVMFICIFRFFIGFNNTAIQPMYSFTESCISCFLPLIYGAGYSESTSRKQSSRRWYTKSYFYQEYLYMYSYDSIVECGSFIKNRTEYVYFSKNRLNDEMFDEFKNRFVLCDENTCAMVSDGGVLAIASRIPGAVFINR